MNELKPCPYCRSDQSHIEELRFGYMARQCGFCDALGPRAVSIEKANQLWNERAYDYGMPGIAKKIEALQAENTRLQHQLSGLEALFTEQGKRLNGLLEANHRMANLLFDDNEQDTNGFSVAALVSALQQYARRENWTRTAEIEYSIDDYVEGGSITLDKAIVWRCGSPGYLLAEAALNGDIGVSESEGNSTV